MAIKVRATVRNGALELSQPLALPDGEEVEILVQPTATRESDEWAETGMSRLEEEWDNPRDSVYDDWRSLYGV